jgi:hypothetical protein
MVFSMPDDFYRTMKQLGNAGTFYCPAGHTQCFPLGETEEAKLRRERDRLQQRIAERDDRISDLEKSNAATRGVVTRIKNRISNGVCPCCNRTFSNLASHIKTKHPSYKNEEAA